MQMGCRWVYTSAVGPDVCCFFAHNTLSPISLTHNKMPECLISIGFNGPHNLGHKTTS